MKDTQNYELKFVRYLLNTHLDVICVLETVSSKLHYAISLALINDPLPIFKTVAG